MLKKWTSEACRKRILACMGGDEKTWTGSPEVQAAFNQMWRDLSLRMSKATKMSLDTSDDTYFMVADYNYDLFVAEWDKMFPAEWIDNPEAYNG